MRGWGRCGRRHRVTAQMAPGESLGVPVVGVSEFAVLEVVQVQALRGGAGVGAGGELPPELGGFVAAGQTQQASEGQSPAGLNGGPVIDQQRHGGDGGRIADHVRGQRPQVTGGSFMQGCRYGAGPGGSPPEDLFAT